MSLSQEEKSIMKQLHLEKAEQFLNNADMYFSKGDFSTSANRYYYACFHAIHALFVMNDIVTKTHDGLNGMFNLKFVKTNIIDSKYGPFIARMENLRNKADYDIVFKVTADDLDKIKPLAHGLFTSIKGILS